MISCYTLLAVYLSSAGALDVYNLDHSYVLLKRNRVVSGEITYVKNGLQYKDTYMIVDKDVIAKDKNANEELVLDKCEVNKKAYYGVFNHEEVKK